MSAWFDRIYNDPLYLTLYEAEDDARARAEAEGACALTAVAPGARWLDVGCGFGRHTEHLSARGLKVCGTDRSALMLRRARARAAAAGADIDYVRADLRRLPFGAHFARASLFFDSFGYFAHDFEHLDALLALAEVLAPHGVLLIHLTNRERLVADFREREEEQHGPYTVTKSRRLDLVRGRLAWTMQIEGPDGPRRWDLDLRLFSASELADLLERAGFDDLRFYGSWDGAPYGPRTPQLIACARKAIFADIPPLGV